MKFYEKVLVKLWLILFLVLNLLAIVFSVLDSSGTPLYVLGTFSIFIMITFLVVIIQIVIDIIRS